ncbi:MAG TPA: pyridoxamine 5'-phosphate oxidase family protein [Actinomycetota bacterium]|nr:pyridoxamine 5'-phosphate oxidase family protein [Actinomycetota bacterium]
MARPVRIDPRVEPFLRHARVARMATTGADGVPHVVPVCPVLDRGRIYVATGGGSRKVRNLEADPRVAIVFDDYVEDWNALRQVMLRGRARLIRRGLRWNELRELFNAKFPQYPEMAPIGHGDVFVEIVPEEVFTSGF